MTELKEVIKEPRKKAFKLFDFFANCEYFEEDFNYDQVLESAHAKGGRRRRNGGAVRHPMPAAPTSIWVQDILVDDQGGKDRRRRNEDRPDVLSRNSRNTVRENPSTSPKPSKLASGIGSSTT